MRKILLSFCAVILLSVSAFGATMGERNALASAKQYLSVMGFSYSGLMNQLEAFDGYSHDEAKYAVENCGANWNAQAARSAKNYLSVMPFSRKGLMEQLVNFDGYTCEQAEYGVKKNGY